VIYIVRHRYLSTEQCDYLKSFDFTGHVSIKTNVLHLFRLRVRYRKTKSRTWERQSDSLCTRRVSHIDETCQYMQKRNLTNFMLNWSTENFVDSNRTVIDIIFLLMHHIIIINCARLTCMYLVVLNWMYSGIVCSDVFHWVASHFHENFTENQSGNNY